MLAIPVEREQEYAEHKRCPSCNKPTAGVDDYKNIRSGSITKTCVKCRESVYTSYKKKERITKRSMTKDDKLSLYHKLVKGIDKEVVLKTIAANPHLFKIWELLEDENIQPSENILIETTTV